MFFTDPDAAPPAEGSAFTRLTAADASEDLGWSLNIIAYVQTV